MIFAFIAMLCVCVLTMSINETKLYLPISLQSTTDNTGGFGQNLVSPGSCLEEFRAQPVIECHGHGRCSYYDQLASFWLAVIEENNQFSQPRQNTLKADQTSQISR